MDRRRIALGLLLGFAACTGAAIVLSGTRSGTGQGTAPWLIQVLGYGFAIAAGVLLLARPTDGSPGRDRRVGAVVVAAIVALIVLDAVAVEGPNIGAGLGRLVLLALVAGAAVRLTLGGSARRT